MNKKRDRLILTVFCATFLPAGYFIIHLMQ